MTFGGHRQNYFRGSLLKYPTLPGISRQYPTNSITTVYNDVYTKLTLSKQSFCCKLLVARKLQRYRPLRQ